MHLSRLLRPRSIAVLGGGPATRVIRQNLSMGFAGTIWPVHPREKEICGVKAFPALADLPAPPDAVFLGVNRTLTVDLVGELAAMGAGGVVAYASGFAEAGPDGVALQRALCAAAGEMPVLGPNCYGLINYLDGTLLWPDQHGGRRVERGVALVTQSGNIGLNLTMQRRGLPIAYLATLGNQAMIGLSGMIEAMLDDERVSAIGLHIEAIDDPGAFARAALRAKRRGVPIVAVKTGSSPEGASLTVSHTASLAGADKVVGAFFEKVGVVRVETLPVLIETLKILHLQGPLPGRGIASMSCSGGEAALIADRAPLYGLHFPALDQDQREAVAATFPPLVAVSNPLDYHTFSWANRPALTESFAAMMAAGFAETLLILDMPREDRCDDADWRIAADALADAAARTGERGAVVATLPESLPEAYAQSLMAKGLVPLFGLDDALAALSAAARAGEDSEYSRLLTPAPAAGKTVTLSEWDSKRLLAGYGLSVPEARLATSPAEAVEAARALGVTPLVVKAVGADLAHKTERGAVKLGLRDEAAVAAAAEDLRGLGEALLVEAMVPDAVAELIVGVTRDDQFGPVLMLGSGGILVELVGDSVLLLPPVSRDEILAAVRKLKVAKLLDGYRGKPPGDWDALAEAVLAIQRFVIDQSQDLLELDVNPLIARPRGKGAVAVDALIRKREA